MSNEYKDWKIDKIYSERTLVKEYPFLHVRDFEGNLDIGAEFPLLYLELPDGWVSLFFQMCSDLRKILAEENTLDTFYFVQVKEKYNKLTCYYEGGASDRVKDIIARYEYISSYVCTRCGKPAKYQTCGYIESFCLDCWQKYCDLVESKKLDIKIENEKLLALTEWNTYLQNNKDFNEV